MPTREQKEAVIERIGFLRGCTFRVVDTQLNRKFRIITGKAHEDDYHWSKLDWSAQRIILMNLVDWTGFDKNQKIGMIESVQTGNASGE
jgi:hypothetical protein